MKLDRILNYCILNAGILLLLLLIGAGIEIKQNINSNQVPQPKPYYSRMHLLKSKYSYQVINKMNSRKAKQISGRDKFDRKTNQWLLRDINKEREKRHIKPLKLAINNQKLADARNPFVYNAYLTESNYLKYSNYQNRSNYTDNYIHGEDNGESSINIIKAMRLYNYTLHGAAENAGNVDLGLRNESFVGDEKLYKTCTPKEVANATINSEVYYDKSDIQGANNNNGHRNNILNPHYHYIGIASYDLPNYTYHHTYTNLMSNVEEFN